jgi:hypothetical protein
MQLGLSHSGKNKDSRPMFERRVLWRILVLDRNEVTGNWRNLHNGKFHNL